MDETSIENAVERIGAALERLEAAARGCSRLIDRHQALKTSVARSLADLDTLLAGIDTKEPAK